MPDTGEKPGRYVLKSADHRGIRWRQGERLEQLSEERRDALRRARQDGGRLAAGPAGRLTHAELDRRASKLARFFMLAALNEERRAVDHIHPGPGCTTGPGAFAHYHVTMGDESLLEAGSLMKGTHVRAE